MRSLMLLILLICSSLSLAAEYAVVMANSASVSELNESYIRDIFLRRRNFDGGLKLIPVNLVGEDPARVSFERLVLQMDREQLSKYWVSNHFQGISPPTTQSSFPSVKVFIGRVSGAIGYVPLSMVDESLKVLYEF